MSGEERCAFKKKRKKPPESMLQPCKLAVVALDEFKLYWTVAATLHHSDVKSEISFVHLACQPRKRETVSVNLKTAFGAKTDEFFFML